MSTLTTNTASLTEMDLEMEPKRRSRQSAQIRPFVAEEYDEFIRDYLRGLYEDPTIEGNAKKMIEKVERNRRLSYPLKYTIVRQIEAYIRSRKIVYTHCLFFRSREEIDEFYQLLVIQNSQCDLISDAIYDGDTEMPEVDPFVWEFRSNLDHFSLYATVGEICLYDDHWDIGFLYDPQGVTHF